MEWISVKDRLPEKNSCILVTFEDQGICQAFYKYWDDLDWSFPSFDCDLFTWDKEKITHWMPLPEPPKDE